MAERVEYGVIDGDGRLAMPLGVPYTTRRAADQQRAWLEALWPVEGEPCGPFTVVQRILVVKVSEWEPSPVPLPEPSEGEK